jgi:XRE family transcriptional regulator, regulator of sulfur utilization
MTDELGERIARNLKQLSEARGLTQEQMAKVANVPRATWTNLESGSANPTLSVLHRAAGALQVTIEELLSTPRAACEYFPFGSLPQRRQGNAHIRKLLPHAIPGMEMDRIELPAGGRMPGVPHTPGTREYLTCEEGEIVLTAAGERWHLKPGDVVAFRGDQRHSYSNPGDAVAVGYSVVVLAHMV